MTDVPTPSPNPQRRLIDQHALRIPQASRLSPCLYVPLAARDIPAIEAFVGRVVAQLSRTPEARALLVESFEPEPPDMCLPIWSLPEAAVLHAPRQVWVHVNYTRYRFAYQKAFPDAELSEHVLDHVMNRRVARVKGFTFLRVVAISRQANSSHGGLSEKWAVDFHSSPRMMEKHRSSHASVQYADISDIVKMLNMQGGGALMDIVNEAQKLVDPPQP